MAVGIALWQLPAGTLKTGEEPRRCAARELKGETGSTAQVIEPPGSFFNALGWSTDRPFTFAATGLLADEQIEVRVKPEANVWAMIARGDMVDGRTITTFALRAAGAIAPAPGRDGHRPWTGKTLALSS
jgi:ADP-ribose pyrophosphatase